MFTACKLLRCGHPHFRVGRLRQGSGRSAGYSATKGFFPPGTSASPTSPPQMGGQRETPGPIQIISPPSGVCRCVDTVHLEQIGAWVGSLCVPSITVPGL